MDRHHAAQCLSDNRYPDRGPASALGVPADRGGADAGGLAARGAPVDGVVRKQARRPVTPWPPAPQTHAPRTKRRRGPGPAPSFYPSGRASEGHVVPEGLGIVAERQEPELRAALLGCGPIGCRFAEGLAQLALQLFRAIRVREQVINKQVNLVTTLRLAHHILPGRFARL